MRVVAVRNRFVRRIPRHRPQRDGTRSRAPEERRSNLVPNRVRARAERKECPTHVDSEAESLDDLREGRLVLTLSCTRREPPEPNLEHPLVGIVARNEQPALHDAWH